MRSSIFGFVAAALLTGSTYAASSLIGIEFNSPNNLFDINKATAATNNLRATNVPVPIGIAVSSSGTIYTASAGGAGSTLLYTVNQTTGASTLVGPTGLATLFEGGLAFSPGGILFGCWDASKDLVTINTTTGAATIIGPISGSDDVSALAFNSSGTLFALDLHTNTGSIPQLYTLNTATGAILTTTTMSPFTNAAVAGMAFDPDSGSLYLAASGIATLYTVNSSTGVTTSVGSLGAPGLDVSGIAFVSVPEPSCAVACIALGGVLLRRSRTRRA